MVYNNALMLLKMSRIMKIQDCRSCDAHMHSTHIYSNKISEAYKLAMPRIYRTSRNG